MQDGHVNINWLSITALKAGLTLADILQYSEVFVNIRLGLSYLKRQIPDCLNGYFLRQQTSAVKQGLGRIQTQTSAIRQEPGLILSKLL